MDFLHVIDVRNIADYRLWLRFDDGSDGEVDLGDALSGPIFRPLQDVARFEQVRVEEERYRGPKEPISPGKSGVEVGHHCGVTTSE